MTLPIDIELYKDVGTAGAALIIVIGLSRWVAIRSFQYIEKANNALTDSQNNFIHFAEDTIDKNTRMVEESINKNTRLLEGAISKNTETLSNMHAALEINTQTMNNAIDIIKEKDKALNFLYEMLKEEIRIGHRKE